MPFPSAVSNQSSIRSGAYSAQRYAAIHTPTVQLQLNPSAAASGKSNASIPYTTTLQGSTANVLLGMLLVITPTTDYVDDLQTQPENCLVERIRKAPTSTEVFIGETAFQWSTGDVVTVLDDFRVFEKRTRIAGSTIYKDYDITVRDPLPRLYDLYSDVQLISGTNTNYSPTPSATAMASGATISSWSWDVIENGTVSTAVSTSATPTFNLDTGTHWLIARVTDSGGQTHWLAVLVAIVPDTLDSVVDSGVVRTINYDVHRGITAGIEKADSAATLVPGSSAIVFSRIHYTDNTSETIVEMRGWLGGKVELSVAGDDVQGQIQSFADSIQGVRALMDPIRLPAFPVREKGTPSEWGHLARSGAYDALWYLVSEHSTVASVSAQDYPSDWADYRFPNINTPAGTLPNGVDGLTMRAMGGQPNYSPHGEMVYRQSLLYETSDTDRNNATVYATYATQDAQNVRVQRTPPGLFAMSVVLAGFATYNTTRASVRIYHSQAPAGFVPSDLLEELDGILLPKDLSDAIARQTAGQFTANHFFAGTDATLIDLTLTEGYQVFPASHIWHQLTLTTSETLDGSAFDSNTRHLCIALNSTYDPDEGMILQDVTLREETDGGDNYANETQFVPLGTVDAYPTYPISSGYPDLGEFDIESMPDYYGPEYDDNREEWEDPTLPPEQSSEESNTDTSWDETIYVSMRGGAITTSNSFPVGTDNILVQVSGDGQLANDAWEAEFDFTQSDGGWTVYSNRASYTAGLGWENGTVNTEVVQIEYSFATSTTVTSAIVYVTEGPNRGFQARMPDVNGADFSSGFFDGNQTIGDVEIGVSSTAIWMSVDNQTPKVTYTGAITKIILRGVGTHPVTGAAGSDSIRGDAFYHGYQDGEIASAYNAQGGLNIDGSGIVHGEDFSPDHVYEFTIDGDGSQLSFSFTDSVDNDYTNNEQRFLKVRLREL